MTMSKEKGTRGELQVREYLRSKVNLQFERTPNSGATNTKGLKGDIFILNHHNNFTIEVKFYEADELGSNVLAGKGTFKDWWQQALREAKDNGNLPMLIYKWNRSALFCVLPTSFDAKSKNYIEISNLGCRIYLMTDLDCKYLFEDKHV